MPDFDASDRQRKNDSKVVAPHSKTVRLSAFARDLFPSRSIQKNLSPRGKALRQSWSKWGIEVKRTFVRWLITALDNWLRG